MAWFKKQKPKSAAESKAGGAYVACPICGASSFVAVSHALPRTQDEKQRVPMGELVDENTGYCSACGLIAWGKVYASSGSEDERARRALLNNTLLLAWTEECRERHRHGEPSTKEDEKLFLSGARKAFGLEFDQLNHKQFVTICLEGAQSRLRKR
jgi:hypothetical protein